MRLIIGSAKLARCRRANQRIQEYKLLCVTLSRMQYLHGCQRHSEFVCGCHEELIADSRRFNMCECAAGFHNWCSLVCCDSLRLSST